MFNLCSLRFCMNRIKNSLSCYTCGVLVNKFVFTILLAMPLLSNAMETNLFLCLTPSQSFEIKLNPKTKQMVGHLFTSSEKKITFSCETKDYGYLCKDNDYYAKVVRGNTGRMIVQLELDGGFGLTDSGHLNTLYCRQF